MTPMRKILELIIYCKKIAEECDKASASHDDQSKRNWKKSRQKKATQRMSDNKPRRLQLKPEKKKKTKKHEDDNSRSKRNYGLETMGFN